MTEPSASASTRLESDVSSVSPEQMAHMEAIITKSAAPNAGAAVATYAIEQGFDIPEDIALKLVSAWGLTISSIPNPSEAVQLAAVSTDGMALVRIMRDHKMMPSVSVITAAFRQCPKLIDQFENHENPIVSNIALKLRLAQEIEKNRELTSKVMNSEIVIRNLQRKFDDVKVGITNLLAA